MIKSRIHIDPSFYFHHLSRGKIVKIDVMLDLLFQIPTPHMNEGSFQTKNGEKRKKSPA